MLKEIAASVENGSPLAATMPVVPSADLPQTSISRIELLKSAGFKHGFQMTLPIDEFWQGRNSDSFQTHLLRKIEELEKGPLQRVGLNRSNLAVHYIYFYDTTDSGEVVDHEYPPSVIHDYYPSPDQREEERNMRLNFFGGLEDSIDGMLYITIKTT